MNLTKIKFCFRVVFYIFNHTKNFQSLKLPYRSHAPKSPYLTAPLSRPPKLVPLVFARRALSLLRLQPPWHLKVGFCVCYSDLEHNLSHLCIIETTVPDTYPPVTTSGSIPTTEPCPTSEPCPTTEPCPNVTTVDPCPEFTTCPTMEPCSTVTIEDCPTVTSDACSPCACEETTTALEGLIIFNFIAE